MGKEVGKSQKPRKIAVFLKGYPRISETFIAKELLWLEKQGFELVFFSLRKPTDSKTHPVHDEIKADIVYLPEYLYQSPWHVFTSFCRALCFVPLGLCRLLKQFLGDLRHDPTPNRVRRLGQAIVAWRIMRDMDKHANNARQFDWIYAHFMHTPASVAMYTSILNGLDWSCSAHAKDIWTSPAAELSQKLSSMKFLATCTKTNVDYLSSIAQNQTDADKVHLIYHGLDLTRFVPPTMAKERHPGDPIKLVTVGRAVPKKGFDDLLSALAILSKERPDIQWSLDHIGDGALLSDLQNMADQFGIADRVRWHGLQDQAFVLDLLRQSDVFVLACVVMKDGDRDGLPNVLMEAQSQALPAIGTNMSALPELITDGHNGLLVDMHAPDQLMKAITRLYDHPDLYHIMSENAKSIIQKRFEETHELQKLGKLFKMG